MTKARDLANIISGGFTDADIPNLPASKITSGTLDNARITLDAAEIPNISTDKLTSGTLANARVADLPASKITSGELANARVADLPTSKITSGTFADARISAGSVTQHVAATDLQPLKSDLTALALREATNEASAAFNLPNSFIDTFATDVLGTKTDLGITSGYVSTSTLGAEIEFDYAASNSGSGLTATKEGSNTWGTTNTVGGSGNANVAMYDTNVSYIWHTGGLNVGSGFRIDYLTGYRWTKFLVGKHITWGDITGIQLWHSDDGSSWTGFDLTGATETLKQNFTSGTDTTNLSGFSNVGVMYWGDFSASGFNEPNTTWNTVSGFAPVTKRYLKMLTTSVRDGGNANAGYGKFRWWYTPQTHSTTGTAIQATNTVGSAKTVVGGTMLYKDNVGTNTLGTDLKIYFTCNGGTNWTEAASYNAITPVYSTGIKHVRLGETTCTSGTDIRWKAVYANQTNGSRDAQLHGIGLNY